MAFFATRREEVGQWLIRITGTKAVVSWIIMAR